MLFLDSAQLTAGHHTAGISKLVLIHCLIVRSQQQQKALQLPNTLYDLSREEYMKWMDSIDNEKEVVQLALDSITKGSKLTESQLEEIVEYKLILAIASDE